MSQIIDAATRSLQQTATAAQKSLGQLQATIEGQIAEIQTNANKIADQETTFAENEKAIETAVRNAAAEIRLQVKEDADSVLSDLLGERGLISLKPTDVRDLEERAAIAERDAANEAAKAVKAAEQKLHSEYGAKLSAVKHESALQLAEHVANAKADKAQIEMLIKQVDTLENTIALNREAETARTQALAQSSVTVNNNK